MTEQQPERGQPEQPTLVGDLPTVLEVGPAFATAMRGYDRMQVDNYVGWAENELRASQRLTTELLERLTASESELHRARQLLARSERDRDLVRLSDRVADLLRLAAQEAAANADATAHDTAQAEDVVAKGREEAEVVIRRARALEARAAARLQDAERRLGEARTVEEETRSRVRTMLQDASDERERLEEAAAARRVEAEQELRDLQRRRYRARELLRQLTARVDEVLATLSGEEPPAGYSFSANRAGSPADGPRTDRITPTSRALSA
jgi:cell division septum initiation protein DivIVA